MIKHLALSLLYLILALSLLPFIAVYYVVERIYENSGRDERKNTGRDDMGDDSEGC
jgi:hypothetical protein